jgi:phospholipase/carboxylesterase
MAAMLLALAAARCALVGAAGPDASERRKTYADYWEKAQKAYADQEYRRAAACYEKVCDLLPFEPLSRFQLACCRARLGEKDQALAALEAAIRFGWDQPRRIEQADDLKVLRGLPRFARLVKEAASCRDETAVLHAGTSVDPARAAPLLIVLHGLGCGPRSEVPYWEPAADRLGLVVVAPRGTTRVAPLLCGWQRPGARDSNAPDYFDVVAARRRVGEAITLAEKKFKIDTKHVVLAGFSQGGGVALHLLGNQPEPYCGAVAVCSLWQPPAVGAWRAVAKQRAVRVVVLAGRQDRLLPRSQQAVARLRAAGLTPRYEELARLGHEYPPDYPDRLRRALEYVLDREAPTR